MPPCGLLESVLSGVPGRFRTVAVVPSSIVSAPGTCRGPWGERGEDDLRGVCGAPSPSPPPQRHCPMARIKLYLYVDPYTPQTTHNTHAGSSTAEMSCWTSAGAPDSARCLRGSTCLSSGEAMCAGAGRGGSTGAVSCSAEGVSSNRWGSAAVAAAAAWSPACPWMLHVQGDGGAHVL